jgi:flagellar M-ring protein FliF
VKSAVGFDSVRGDRVTVVGVPFARPEVIPEEPVLAPTMIEKVRVNQPLILNVGALVMAFVIGFMALRSMRTTTPQLAAAGAGTEALAAGPGYQAALPQAERFDFTALPSGPSQEVHDGSRVVQMTPELAALQANQETKHRVTNTVDQQPEVAAKLIRAWMKEA